MTSRPAAVVRISAPLSSIPSNRPTRLSRPVRAVMVRPSRVARAVQAANVAAWLGEREGHHPDVRFGWGYCEVSFTTHEAGGLTDNDLICAAKLSRLLD